VAECLRAPVRDVAMSDKTIVKKAADRGIKLLDGGNPPVPQPSAPAAVRLLAEQYGQEAVRVLLEIATDGESEAARVAACKELLDRGFGKVPQPVEGGGPGVNIINVVTGVRGRD
jgi:hypothetical protein